MDNDLFQIINTPWANLDSDELKIYSIILFILSFLGGIVASLILSKTFSMNIYYALFVFLVLSVLMTIFTYKRDWFDNKYGIFSEFHIGMNYSVVFYLLVILNIVISLLFFYPNFKSYGLTFAVIMFFSQYLPLIFMLFRINVFDDKNCQIIRKDDYGNEYYENTIGYNPLIYFLINMPFAIITGFYMNNFINDLLNSTYLTFNLIYLIISLLILFLIASPDLLNKKLPFELRTLGGVLKFITLLLIIIIVIKYLLNVFY